VQGRLLPESPGPLEDLLAKVAARPDLAALERQAQAAELELRAAQRGWIPEPTLGAGVKQVEQGSETGTGPLLSLSLPLPLLDRQRPEQVRAAAELQIARHRRRVVLAEAAGEIRGLWQQTRALTDAARRLREQTGRSTPDLVRAAEAAYEGAEIGILELLDAYRSALDADLDALALERDARQARIELDQLTGDVIP
jgi:cobalt-zinc-cadmium efflux system outer membrane protein